MSLEKKSNEKSDIISRNQILTGHEKFQPYFVDGLEQKSLGFKTPSCLLSQNCSLKSTCDGSTTARTPTFIKSTFLSSSTFKHERKILLERQVLRTCRM